MLSASSISQWYYLNGRNRGGFAMQTSWKIKKVTLLSRTKTTTSWRMASPRIQCNPFTVRVPFQAKLLLAPLDVALNLHSTWEHDWKMEPGLCLTVWWLRARLQKLDNLFLIWPTATRKLKTTEQMVKRMWSRRKNERSACAQLLTKKLITLD